MLKQPNEFQSLSMLLIVDIMLLKEIQGMKVIILTKLKLPLEEKQLRALNIVPNFMDMVQMTLFLLYYSIDVANYLFALQ